MSDDALKARAELCRRRAAGSHHAVSRHLWLSAAGHFESALQHHGRGVKAERSAERYEAAHGGDDDAEPE